MEIGIRPRSLPQVEPPPVSLTPTSGWAAFDALQRVRPGRVLLVDVGCRAASRLLMSLLASTVAQGREAVVVDGGNWLDVYDLGNQARAHGLRRQAVLEGVRVARGFTAYQLQSLVEDALPKMLDEGMAGLALASCLSEMYLDDDLAPEEARVLVTRALRTLRALARKHDVPVIVSNMTLAPGQRHKLRAALDAGVDDAVALFPAPHRGMRILARGMDAPLLATDPRTCQRVLSEFAFEARVDDTPPEEAFARHGYDARLRYAPKRAGELGAKQKEEARVTLAQAFSGMAGPVGGV